MINLRNQTICIAVLLLLSALPINQLYAEKEVLDRVVAIVNDDIISLSQVEGRYQLVLRQFAANNIREIPSRKTIIDQIMELLIVESIQLQEATYRGFLVSEEEVTEIIRAMARENNLDIEQFRERLQTDGISYAEFREDVHRQSVIQKVQSAVVNRRIFITEQDIKEFRNSPFFGLLATDQYRIGHILIPISEEAQNSDTQSNQRRASDIVKQLRDGADFAIMAVNESAASTALEGGDLGWRDSQDIPSLFAETVVGMEVGDISEPIVNERGFHIIKLLDKRGSSGSKGEQTLVRHILIQPNAIKTDLQAKREIEGIRQRILDGEDFDTLAQEFSDDPGSARNGGKLDWIDGNDLKDLDPQFVEELHATDIGEVSVVFATQFGWHILEVLERRVADLTEENLNNLALRALHSRQFEEALQDWLQEIREEAFVKIVYNP